VFLQMLERDFRFFHPRSCEIVIEYSRRLKTKSTIGAEAA